MKKLIAFIIGFSSLCSYTALACDVCGGGSLGFSGAQPLITQGFIGFQSSFQGFKHPSSSLSSSGSGLVLRDSYQSFELQARKNLSKKWQGSISIPYRIHRRIEEEQSSELRGIGDVQLALRYQILDLQDPTKSLVHFLAVDGYLGLPTGKYMQRDAQKAMLPIWMQLGKGAWQYGAGVNYSLRYKKLGFNMLATTRYFTENELSYRVGNQSFISSDLFVVIPVKSVSFVLSAGPAWEQLKADHQYGIQVLETGANRVYAQGGLTVLYKKWMASVNIQEALNQTVSAQQPKVKAMMACSLLYSF